MFDLPLLLLLVMVGYGIVGLVCALWLSARHRLQKMDHSVEGATPGFHGITWPSRILLWPHLWWLHRQVERQVWELPRPEHPLSPRQLRGGHRLGWSLVLFVLLPLLLWILTHRIPPSLPASSLLPSAPTVDAVTP